MEGRLCFWRMVDLDGYRGAQIEEVDCFSGYTKSAMDRENIFF
jgi:hypothetical protein